MMKLEMNSMSERKALKKYFYDEKSAMLFWVCLILIPFTMGVSFVFFLGVKIAQFFINSSGDEVMYDRVLEKDIEFLKDRAVNTMGFIAEELSMIPSIMTHGYIKGSQSVIIANELDAEHKDIFQKLVSFMTSIPSKIISFLVNFFTGKDIMSHSIFFKGRDEKVRCSLVSITMISFTEQQVVAYVCDYDIALGVILNEYVNEVFYRDVESVTYGVETWHVPTNDGSIARIPLSWARITVPSGENIVASMYGENDMLENQVTAMKNLIRSKKEEMT